jgi:uncharacterized membrane protein
MHENTLLRLIFIFAFLGSFVAGYGLYLHYQPVGTGSICNISDTFDCDAVNKSPYSRFLGMPVALIGLGGYLFFMLLSLMDLKNFFGSPMHKLMLFLAVIGFAFTLYLTYLEAFVIYAWCVVCMGSAVIMTIILILSMVYYSRARKKTLTYDSQADRT